MSALTSILTVLLCFLAVFLNKKYIFIPFIAAACFVPIDQRIYIFNLDFTTLRILILLTLVKIAISSNKREIKWNKFDNFIFMWVVVGSLIYTINFGSINAFFYKAGVAFDTLGFYLIIRYYISDWDDVIFILKIFAIFAIITAPLIASENIFRWSIFSYFGHVTSSFHRGRFRAAGSFPHYIIMGCFWATLIPLFYAVYKARIKRVLFFLAIICSISNVIFSASSTSLISLVSVIAFWNIFSFRWYGTPIFVSTLLVLTFLHMIMKQPVWHLMARANIFGGSTGWHRYFLFDNFINHTSEWFWLGTKSTAHWGHVQSDLTNQFVLEGVRGGIITLIIFVIIVYLGVKIPGKLSLITKDEPIRWLSWGICVSMLTHFVTFWGVSYFGQINMILFLTFALVAFCQSNIDTCFENIDDDLSLR